MGNVIPLWRVKNSDLYRDTGAETAAHIIKEYAQKHEHSLR